MTIASRLRTIVDALPPGAAVTLPADAVRAWLGEDGPEPPATAPVPEESVAGWRERLWTCPPDTRLGVREVAEALDRSRDWVYRATSADRAREKGRPPLPCGRLDGELVFSAGALREWIRRCEVVVNPAPDSRRLRAG
jgi:hypothetical protein